MKEQIFEMEKIFGENEIKKHQQELFTSKPETLERVRHEKQERGNRL